jgi:hypothetical protein
VDYGLLERGRKIKSSGRRARVSFDIDSRTVEGQFRCRPGGKHEFFVIFFKLKKISSLIIFR